MGIDGIGSRGPVAPPTVPAAEKAGPATASFEVGKAAPVAPAEVGRTALDRLKAGEIDVHGYVEAKVDEATAHLSALPPANLEAVRAALRDRIASDPTLVDLVRTASGQIPPALGDG